VRGPKRAAPPEPVLRRVALDGLTGAGAHAETPSVFDEFDWKLGGARPAGIPHSIFQLLNHLAFWQDWAVAWLDGDDPPTPRHASGIWPGAAAPASAAEWRASVRRFRRGSAALARRARQGDLLGGQGAKTRLEMLRTIGAHNSYHAGQAALVRRVLGSWPPPSGGATW
jgi:hypothetical protein